MTKTPLQLFQEANAKVADAKRQLADQHNAVALAIGTKLIKALGKNPLRAALEKNLHPEDVKQIEALGLDDVLALAEDRKAKQAEKAEKASRTKSKQSETAAQAEPEQLDPAKIAAGVQRLVETLRPS